MSLPFAKKSLGQHWLTDLSALSAIADAAEINPTDTVLEIGPGVGTLTKLLVKRAQKVVTVEFDQSLASNLHTVVPADNLEVISQDILSFDLTTLPPNYKVVANIPYYLTSKLLRTLSESPNPPTTAVLLVQKEVAQRVAAQPGSMSMLSVSAQYYWQVSLGAFVGAHLFTPPPKVDSMVLIMERRQTPLFQNVVSKDFFRVVKAGYSARRKTLSNALSGGLQISKQQANELLEAAEILPSTRAQTLSLEQWHQLYMVIHQSKNT